MAVDRWTELSEALAALVRHASVSVVRVDGSRRGPSSGVVWSADGVVVAASHALDADDEVAVGLADGATAPAEVVGRDPGTDLAVLRVRASGLAAAALADAPLEVGQLAVAVTRPGRGPRASLGVVARLGDAFRTRSGGKIDRYVELDLALHPGFSGGLALDVAGRPVGLCNAGVARGTPLAIPAATAQRVVTAILAHGAVRRGYLGVSSFPVGLPASLQGVLGQGSALLLTAVEEGSPADRAGLMLGDLLLALGGQPVGDVGDLLPLLEEERIGVVARARIARGGEVREVDVTVGARGERGGRP